MATVNLASFTVRTGGTKYEADCFVSRPILTGRIIRVTIDSHGEQLELAPETLANRWHLQFMVPEKTGAESREAIRSSLESTLFGPSGVLDMLQGGKAIVDICEYVASKLAAYAKKCSGTDLAAIEDQATYRTREQNKAFRSNSAPSGRMARYVSVRSRLLPETTELPFEA